MVGRSNAAKDWPGYQPGSANGSAGYRPHPFTILFDMPEVPRGIYVLKVALLAYTHGSRVYKSTLMAIRRGFISIRSGILARAMNKVLGLPIQARRLLLNFRSSP